MTCKQQIGQSLDDFLQKLRDCDHKAVTTEVHRNEATRDAFISSVLSIPIFNTPGKYQRRVMKLDAIFNQARSLDTAQKNSENFNLSHVATGF